ncbi:MAG: hypothetical protein DRN25_05520, partial [Thermoplasmata archaeon]
MGETDIEINEAKKLLESYGIYGAELGDSGVFDVTPGYYRQVSVEEEVGPEETAYLLPDKPLYILSDVRATFLPCIFGFEPWCWVTKYKDPVIDYVINATRVKDVDVYLLRGRITGKIETNFENKSEEGERWEENVKTGEQRNREKVKGSADLDGVFDEIIHLKDINKTLSELKDRIINETKPDYKITIESNFEKKGYIDMIKSILSLLLRGKIYVDDKIEV